MRRHSICLGLLVMLAGCGAHPYAPPAGGPTSTLNIVLSNKFGFTQFGIEKSFDDDEVLLKSNSIAVAATASRVVPAGQMKLFYSEMNPNAACNLLGIFTAEAGQSYNVYAGDVLPPPRVYHNAFLKVLLNPQPLAGGTCSIVVRQVMPDGSEQDIQLTPPS